MPFISIWMAIATNIIPIKRSIAIKPRFLNTLAKGPAHIKIKPDTSQAANKAANHSGQRSGSVPVCPLQWRFTLPHFGWLRNTSLHTAPARFSRKGTNMSQTTTRRLMNSFRQLRRPQPQRLNSRRRRTAIPEVLETRTLLAADPGVSLFSPFESPDLVDAGSDAAAGLSEYVFIDAGVADSDVLAEGFDRVGTEVVMLEPDRDGWRQIAEHLEGAFELDAIHVLSHGNTGQIFLGDSVYSTANIAESETELRRIGRTRADRSRFRMCGRSQL